MPLEWRRNSCEPPSDYTVHINGKPFTCFLCSIGEAQSTAVYDFIRMNFAKEVFAVADARSAGRGERIEDWTYPPYVKVVRAPIHQPGILREKKVEELWTECKMASLRDKAIVIHCNQSFVQGPSLLAAIMIKAGSTKTQAFECIAQNRTIYHGHCLPLADWPLEEQRHHNTKNVNEVHEWLEHLETRVAVEQWPAYRMCKAESAAEASPFRELTPKLPCCLAESSACVEVDYADCPREAALSDCEVSL